VAVNEVSIGRGEQQHCTGSFVHSAAAAEGHTRVQVVARAVLRRGDAQRNLLAVYFDEGTLFL
jgi:hypothetical protein